MDTAARGRNEGRSPNELFTLFFGYALIVLGLYLLASAAYHEFHGTTRRPLKYMPFSKEDVWDHRSNNGYQFSIIVFKQNNPRLFRHFMNLHWTWAILIEAGGIVLCATQYRIPEQATKPPVGNSPESIS